MPEPTEQVQEGGASATGGIQTALTRQIGPLKTWQWGLAIGESIFPSSGSGSGNAQAPSTAGLGDTSGMPLPLPNVPPVTNITNNYGGGGQAQADALPRNYIGPGSGTSTTTSVSKTISTVHITPPPASTPIKTVVATSSHPATSGPATTVSAESIAAHYVTTPETYRQRLVAANTNPTGSNVRAAPPKTNTAKVTQQMLSAQATNSLTPLNAVIGGGDRVSTNQHVPTAPAGKNIAGKRGAPTGAKRATKSSAGRAPSASKAV
jgi:hypothetical protein